MVGYSAHLNQKLSSSDYIAAGAVSGIGTRLLCQPLDVIKIRFQLQIEKIKKNHAERGKYFSMSQAASLIVKEEGVRALWKGHVPAQLLSIIFSTVNFASFEFLTKTTHNFFATSGNKNISDKWQTSTHFACGSISACLATATSFPFDVVRTRLVGQGEPKVYRGLSHAAISMYTQEGVGSFYKGVFTALIQIAPNAGFMFAFYSMSTSLWKSYISVHSSEKVSSSESLVCGGISGMGAKILTYPLDLVKKRLQIGGFEHARVKFGKTRRYSGMLHCLKIVAIEEGFTGLFKGITPSMWKALLSSGFSFYFYEQACNVISNIHNRGF